jgi:Family of unknown function (DUF5819)
MFKVSTDRTPVRRGVTTLVMVLTGLWLIVHFLFTAVYVTPQNPLKAMTSPVVLPYMNTAFRQVWTLFAPNPVRSNNSVLVKCLHQKAEDKTSPWLDLARPLWTAHQHNRFSAYDRLSRTITNPVRDYLSGPPTLKTVMDVCHRGNKDMCTKGEKALTDWRHAAAEELRAPLSAFCADQARALGAAPFRFLAVRLSKLDPPAWPERWTGKASAQQISVGILPTFPVAPPRIYSLVPQLAAAQRPVTQSLTAQHPESQRPALTPLAGQSGPEE